MIVTRSQSGKDSALFCYAYDSAITISQVRIQFFFYIYDIGSPVSQVEGFRHNINA